MFDVGNTEVWSVHGVASLSLDLLQFLISFISWFAVRHLATLYTAQWECCFGLGGHRIKNHTAIATRQSFPWSPFTAITAEPSLTFNPTLAGLGIADCIYPLFLLHVSHRKVNTHWKDPLLKISKLDQFENYS